MKQIYEKEDLCCGCGMCVYKCPKNAIEMTEDEFGFVYPVINEDECVNCGICKATCQFDKKCVKERKIICYAGANTNQTDLLNSASGSAFAGVARSFLEAGNSVVGADLSVQSGKVVVDHLKIDSVDDLIKLQGSKYTQSNLLPCLSEIDRGLKSGQKVLFSGTPCQVAAVKGAFKKYAESGQLYLIDIICHGVPNQRFLNEHLKVIQEEYKSELTDFSFRNKKYGWGLNGIAKLKNGNEVIVSPETSSYYHFFMDGDIYRPSCYKCPYACLDREGDLTIGDYWGVEQFDSQVLDVNGGLLEKNKGISCILINTENGKRLIDEYGKGIAKCEVDINNVTIINKQLREPSVHTNLRYKLLADYKESGYKSIENAFQSYLKKLNLKQTIAKLVPKFVIKLLKG